jgi:hypothetical protein
MIAASRAVTAAELQALVDRLTAAVVRREALLDALRESSTEVAQIIADGKVLLGLPDIVTTDAEGHAVTIDALAIMTSSRRGSAPA